MLDRADDLLKLALAVAALALGLGVGYYYAVFLPHEAAVTTARLEAREAQQEAARTAKAKKDQELSERKVALAEKARDKYDTCLSYAFSNYSARWQASCRTSNRSDLERRGKCLQQGYGDQYCSSITITPSSDCTLPNTLASDYDSNHREAQKLCLGELEAAKPAGI